MSVGCMTGNERPAEGAGYGTRGHDRRRSRPRRSQRSAATDPGGQTIRVLEARGCYGGRLGAGVLTQYGKALAAPIGRIHWAGAETSDVWNGYMDGAIRSGHRAAEAILDGAR